MSAIVNLIDILKYSTEYLEKKEVEYPRLTAEKIIAWVLKMERLSLYMNYDRPLSKIERDEIKEMLTKRGTSKIPLQYIFGEEYFYGYSFFVDKRVLIPRPDTERLVENVLELLKNVENPKVVDIGTGSGAIAISIGKEREDALVLGVDISKAALEVSEINKSRNDAKNVKFKQSDLFDEIQFYEFDAVISNPPYIPMDEYKSLTSEVKEHEPQNALVAEDEGFYFYKKIAANAKKHLKTNGVIAFESGYNQAQKIAEILKDEGYNSINIFKDYNGIERVVIGRKNV